MNKSQRLAGFWATAAIMLTLGIVVVLEPGRTEIVQNRLQDDQIMAASQDYLTYCSGCHGLLGQGTADYPALDTAGVHAMEIETLQNLIAHGVSNAMPPTAADEGGALTTQQVAQLALLIHTGGWVQVQARLQAVDNLALYVTHCGGCHGLDGSGSQAGPKLDTRRVRQSLPPEQLTEIIQHGTPDETMPGFAETLTPTEISNLVNLLRHWEALVADK